MVEKQRAKCTIAVLQNMWDWVYMVNKVYDFDKCKGPIYIYIYIYRFIQMHIQSINICNWLTLVFIKSNGSFHLCTISISIMYYLIPTILTRLSSLMVFSTTKMCVLNMILF